MKLTKTKLKQIIKEELNNIDGLQEVLLENTRTEAIKYNGTVLEEIRFYLGQLVQLTRNQANK